MVPRINRMESWRWRGEAKDVNVRASLLSAQYSLAFSASCASAYGAKQGCIPYPAIKPKREYRRHKFNELDHENLPLLGGLESCRSATKMRRSCSEECPDFMHCVETSAIELHKQIHPVNGEQTPARMTSPSVAQMRSSHLQMRSLDSERHNAHRLFHRAC